MPGTHDLALFVLAGLLLNLTPGPDTLYIVGRSATQGWRAGAVAALGICAGIFVHIAAAAAGLSALLAASASAFMVVKIAGAAYLVYVGISLIRSPIAPAAKAPALAPAKLRTVFVQGFFTNGTLWNLFVAWSSARVGGGLRRDARFARWFNRCVGGLFVWLGFRLGFSEN